MKINLAMPQLGPEIVTVAQVLDYLQTIELTIDRTARGSIGLFATEKGKHEKELVSLYEPNPSERTEKVYKEYGQEDEKGAGYYAPYPGETEQTKTEGQVTFFGVLTPAAWALVDDFLRQCVEGLKQTLEADGQTNQSRPNIQISIQTPKNYNHEK